MASSDALIVGEDWISEHYFTTDAKSQSFTAKVAERRKAWDEDAANDASTVRSRFTVARRKLATTIGDLLAGQPSGADADLADLYFELRHILGYETGEHTRKRVGPVIHVGTPDLTEAAPLVMVEATAVASVEDLIAAGREVPLQTAPGTVIPHRRRVLVTQADHLRLQAGHQHRQGDHRPTPDHARPGPLPGLMNGSSALCAAPARRIGHKQARKPGTAHKPALRIRVFMFS